MTREETLQVLQGMKETQSHAHRLIIAATERLEDDPITRAILEGASEALASIEPVLTVMAYLKPVETAAA